MDQTIRFYMKNGPLVSVVITCYNYGRYLEKCLKSVLDQTYGNIEIIVVDDGSTDNTPEVIAPFRELPNLRYVRQENSGQARAKNVGIRNSCGEFVAFLDADDLWCEDKLEKQMALFGDRSVGVVYCRARYLDENSVSFEYDMTGRYLQPRRGMVTDWLVFDNFVQFSSTMVRRECLNRFGLFDEGLKMGIDWDLWLRISTAYRFDYVGEPLFYYRMGHAGQMSRNLEERQRCSDRIMERFLKSYPEAVPAVTRRKSRAYTACCRGDYFRVKDRSRSIALYLEALRNNPMELAAYKGVAKILLKRRG